MSIKNECSIVRDLLPIYIEGMTGADTCTFIDEHLAACPACRAEVEAMRTDRLPAPQADLPVRSMQRRIRGVYLRAAALIAAFVLAAVVSVYAQLTRPVYLSPEAAVASISTDNDHLTIEFTARVTGYECRKLNDPDRRCAEYEISAWTSLWNQVFSNNPGGHLALPIDARPAALYYLSNNGNPDRLLYAENGYTADGTRITLPRLALGYYLILMAALAVILILLRLTLRFAKLRRMLDMLWPLPVAYVLAHLAVMGFSTTSYSLLRDLGMILLTSVMNYCALIFLRSLLRAWLQKRQDLASSRR